MTRTGKIARLPLDVRQELNERLQNAESGRALVKWLNGLRRVKRVLKEHFDGQPVNDQNMSDWKRGGYEDWLTRQEAMDVMHGFREESAEIEGDVSAEKLTDELVSWAVVRYLVATKRAMGSKKRSAEKDLRQMRDLCKDVVSLRRGHHYAKWLEMMEKRMNRVEKKSKKEREEEFWKWTKSEEVREKIVAEAMSTVLTPEEREQRIKEIYGRI